MLLKLLLAFQVLAFAEYRVFQLQIDNVETGKTRQVQSTLDHLQYSRLYPLEKNEVITYVDSWMCWENTNNFRPACTRQALDPSLLAQ